jgi:hypothetical protein
MGRLQPETSAEFHLARCLREGRMCDFGDVVTDADKLVRAKFLRNLVVARLSDVGVAPTAISLNNAIIEGDLDCAGFGTAADPLPPLDLAGSTVNGILNLTDSCWTSVRLDDCILSGLSASRLRSDGTISARRLAFDVGEPVAFELDIEPTLTVDLEGLVAGSNVLLNELGRRSSVRSGGFGACWLLLGQCRIGGSLDLSGALLRNAEGDALRMQGADIAGSVFLQPSGRHRFETMGRMDMLGIRIAGSFDARGAGLRGWNGLALTLDNAEIGGSVFFQNFERLRFEAKGGIWLPNAEIGGQLNFIGACLDCAAQGALQMHGAKVRAALLFRSQDGFRFESVGTLSLREAQVATLDGSGASCDAGAGRIALHMDGAEIAGNVILRGQEEWRFESSGMVSLLDAKIAGVFDVSGALLKGRNQAAPTSPESSAIIGDRATIAGSVFLASTLQHRFVAVGGVRFLGASLGGQFNCLGAHFTNANGDALNLELASVALGVLLRGSASARFSAKGRVNLFGTRIGNQLECDGARFMNRRGVALYASNAEIKSSVFLRSDRRLPFEACGTIAMSGCEIGGNLEVGRTNTQALRERIVSPDTILNLTGSTVRQTLTIRLGMKSAGVIILRGARVGELDDDGGTGWGDPARYRPARRQSVGNNSIMGVLLRIDGFVYERLGSVVAASGAAVAASRQSIWRLRKRWLERQYIPTNPGVRDFYPQPHEHLVQTLRLMGHERDARHVANHKSEHESRCKVNNAWQRFYKAAYRKLFGSGYLPERGIATVAGWLLIGTVMVYGALLSNKMGDVVFVRSASSVEVMRSLAEPDKLARSPTFDPARDRQDKDGASFGALGKVQARDLPCTGIYPPLYALDMMLPFVGLHIADKCEMADDAPVWAYAKAAYEMLGWLIIALAALTWTGVLRRD